MSGRGLLPRGHWPVAVAGLRLALAGVVLLGCSGCASLMASASQRVSSSLAAAILDQDDPETVRQGAPAYLLLVDGLVQDNPDNAGLLLTASRLYSSYAAAFVDDPERTRRLAVRGRDYGWRALCASNRSTCASWELPYDRFEAVVRGLGRKDVPALYGSAAAWASWIQANRSDWVAVADKARVELMMQRVVELDETYDRGASHLYLGVLATLIPEALGGKPEDGRRHFERAAELAGGRNLTAPLLLASEYARSVYDRELHDRACHEVLAAEAREPGLTLANVLAQTRARQLLATSEEYFGE